MKWNKLLFSLILILGIGIFATNTTANASSWHKGTPKMLRGNYSKQNNNNSENYIIKSNRIIYEGGGNPTIFSNKNIHYKYLGHKKYLLKYDAPKNGGFLGAKNIKDYVTKSGKNIKLSKFKNEKPILLYRTKFQA